jgi:hypothetical protein
MSRPVAAQPCWLVRIACGFVVGFIAVSLFHQPVWGLFYATGMSPVAPYPLQPIPPFGVPRLLSQAFWGGMWGLVLASLIWRRDGAAYWLIAAAFGLVALTLTGLYVVPLLKGLPPGSFRTMDEAPWMIQMLRPLPNLAWGLGTALLLRLLKLAIGKTA